MGVGAEEKEALWFGLLASRGRRAELGRVRKKRRKGPIRTLQAERTRTSWADGRRAAQEGKGRPSGPSPEEKWRRLSFGPLARFNLFPLFI